MEIMKGAEAFSVTNPSDIGVLLIHGFSGSPNEMSYLGEELGRAGFNVECPRLKGHGTNWKDMDYVRYTDWYRDVEYALRNLKERASRIYVAGSSMGGALALHLAVEHPEIHAVFAVNPVIYLKGILVQFLFFLRFLVPYKEKRKDRGNRRHIKDRSIKLVNYNVLPTKGVYQMKKMVAQVRKELRKVFQPVIVFRSREDSQLLLNIKTIMKRVSTPDPQLIWLDNSYHVATMDFDRKFMAGKMIDYILSSEKTGEQA